MSDTADSPMAGVDTSAPDSAASAVSSCGTGSPYNGSLGLRVAAIFIILATSTFGALLPVLTRRIRRFRIPTPAFDFARYFGAGVIIATAFIHLLAPAFDSLASDCLADGTWGLYPFASAIAMGSVFGIFLIEFFAFRFGMAMLEKMGVTLDAGQLHGAPGELHHHHTAHEHRPDHMLVEPKPPISLADQVDNEKGEVRSVSSGTSQDAALAQLLGVTILEFGVIFHSIVIGLTLAVTDDFITLFVVIIFHQMFEGLGLGARLAFLPLPSRLNWVPIAMAVAYAICTPIGIAIGLGVRETYDPESTTALIAQGVLDATSAGILLYTGLVELLAHEFIFSSTWKTAPMSRVLYAFGCVLLGAGIMALLGRWA